MNVSSFEDGAPRAIWKTLLVANRSSIRRLQATRRVPEPAYAPVDGKWRSQLDGSIGCH